MAFAQQARTPEWDVRPPTSMDPRGWSLYAQVVTVNTAILVGAAVLLAVSPVTVSFPLSAEQGVVLGVGVAVSVFANATLLRPNFTGLSFLVRQMEKLDLLRTGERLPPRGGLETRTLIRGYNTMLDSLENERRTSTRRSVSALEGERSRIGHELHDEIGQRLTGVLLQLSRAREDLPDTSQAAMHQIQNEIRATLDEVGRLAWQLRPGILDDLGLLCAVEALADAFGEHADAQIHADLARRLPTMTAEVELAFYRVAQEALTNAVRHAHASTVTVRLSCDATAVRLTVVDDGCGLDADAVEAAGIRGMRERALLVQGRLDLQSGQSGTRLLFEVATPAQSHGA